MDVTLRRTAMSVNLSDNQKNILYKHRIAHELAESDPEYSAYAHFLYRAGVEDFGHSIPKSHAELYPHCPKCGGMRREVSTCTRSKRSIAAAKKKARRRRRKGQEQGEDMKDVDEDGIIRTFIIAHCLTCQFVYRLPGSSVSHIREFESRKRKYLSDLTYDPTLILEAMSSGGSASSSRAASPMPLSQSQPQTSSSNKKKKKGKHPSSLQELLARNKMREMDKNSKSNNSSQPNTPSSGLGAFLSSYD